MPGRVTQRTVRHALPATHRPRPAPGTARHLITCCSSRAAFRAAFRAHAPTHPPIPPRDCATCKLAQPDSYHKTYGITTTEDALTLPFLYKSVRGPRVYLLDGNTPDSNYPMFSMLNQEVSFDVEMTMMGCGFNGAVYFVEIAADGGMSTGTQGPAYGTGYSDAQCPFDGVMTPTGNLNLDSTAVYCNEMDLSEAKQAAAAFTPYPCLRPDGTAMVGPYV